MKKWWIFIQERFDPVSHLLMVGLFTWAHISTVAPMVDTSPGLYQSALLFVGVLAFFLKLRFYDEIKDYQTDLKINPTRPLARGLITHSDLYRGIGLCIVTEVLCFGYLAGNEGRSLIGLALAIGYSLLMFKEFFIGPWIRPHLTTYAVTHTLVSSLLSLAIFSVLTNIDFWSLPRPLLFFALNSWLLFNIFEFGRKTFTTSEERPAVESYSRIFRRSGAVGLVVSQAYLSLWILTSISGRNIGLVAVFNILILTGIIFVLANRSPWGRIYRGFTSAYIILVYLIWIRG